MSDKTPALKRLALAVSTKHRAHLARLAQITTQIARVDQAIAELRRAPTATEDSPLQALGERQAWAWRKEQHLLKVREALAMEASRARAKAARSHGEERASERLLQTAHDERITALEKRAEREAPPLPGKDLWS